MAGEILSRYVTPGSRVDIREIKREKNTEVWSEIKVYQSKIYDVLTEDRLEIVMPMEKVKFILLPVGKEYDLFFYSGNSIYQCRAKVVDRNKKNNTYLLIMDLISNLRKDQRREYYRFSCALEMNSRALEQDEVLSLEEKGMRESMVPGIPLERSVIVDISGGGLRFVSDYKYAEGSVILCKFQLETDEETKFYQLLGKVLNIREVENRPGLFEHRIKYMNINKEVREEIIKFIFEEERKSLKKKGKE